MPSRPTLTSGSTPFSSFSKDELVSMLQRAEAEIVTLKRERSTTGGVWGWPEDPAGLRPKSNGGRFAQVWLEPEAVRNFLDLPLEPKPLSRPSPRLPVELLRDIASVCDVRSLASLCRTNFLFLEIASPILYETMVIVDRRHLDAFEHATYSPSLSLLLPRLSLQSVQALHIPIHERSRQDDGLDDQLPRLAFPNLRTLQINVVDSDYPDDDRFVSIIPCLPILVPLNPVEVIFNRSDPSDAWANFETDYWEPCSKAWTNLSLIRFRNINIADGACFLFETDPRPYTQHPRRFVWDVKGTDFDAFLSETMLTTVMGYIGQEWNKAGVAGVVVETQEQLKLVEEEVKKVLEEDEWKLVRVVVA